MALPKVDYPELQYLDQWFTNTVDTINYNSTQIESAVPALVNVLTTIDTVPIQYLRDSFNKIVDNINKGFSEIEDRLKAMESRIAGMQQGGEKNGMV